MYGTDNKFGPIGQNTSAPNSSIADLSQYINPHVRNIRIQNFLGNQVQGVRKPERPDTYKTVMCQAWLESMSCKFNDQCKFAHGEHELRPSNIPIRNKSKYKSRPCMKYLAGMCPFGVRCLFIHDPNSIPMTQAPPETTTFGSIIGSGSNSPVSTATSLDRPSPIFDPIQSIWASDPKTPSPHQQKFNKSEGLQHTPAREDLDEKKMQESSVKDNTGTPLPFNQTAEEMVSFLWM